MLAALPGGGGTPLAHAIELAEQLAATIQRQGITPTTVFFTDGNGQYRAGWDARTTSGSGRCTDRSETVSTADQSYLIDRLLSPRQ